MASAEIPKIPDLQGFFAPGVDLHRIPFSPSRVDWIAGWGLRRTGQRARILSGRYSVPILTLEDGFLRSAGLGVHGARPLSLVADDLGLYLDASAPSRLERLLQIPGWESEQIADRARAGISEMRALRMSKYNLPEGRSGRLPMGSFVLLADQTAGDVSIPAGLASAESFKAMLLTAREENPGRRLLLRGHPDVVAGKRKGYLLPLAREFGVEVMDSGVSAWQALEGCERVYTVSSQIGLEALIAGKPVRCFGMPFYAGWGATEDELSCERRTRRRTAEEIFAAAFLLYARYVDPFTGRGTSFENTIDTLACWRQAASRGRSVCLGVSRWKRQSIRRMLGFGGASVSFRRGAAGAIREAQRSGGRVVVWASREPKGLASAAHQAGVPVARIEDGFIRSVGLGAALIPGLSYVLDGRGMHFDPRSESDLEAIIQEGCFPERTLRRAADLRRQLIERGVTKYNLQACGSASSIPTSQGRRLILVAGQVEDDASIRLGAGQIRRNADLLKAVRLENPDALIAWKAHPDVLAGLRAGAVPAHQVAGLADIDMSAAGTARLLDQMDEVHVMTSSIGFEALLRGKRVVTYGSPFYAGWGLTEDKMSPPRRTRRASLDELVAAALLLYPSYVDPRTGLPCTAEVALSRLAETDLWQQSLLTRARVLWGRLRRAASWSRAEGAPGSTDPAGQQAV